jgi:hypothetical protein
LKYIDQLIADEIETKEEIKEEVKAKVESQPKKKGPQKKPKNQWRRPGLGNEAEREHSPVINTIQIIRS